MSACSGKLIETLKNSKIVTERKRIYEWTNKKQIEKKEPPKNDKWMEWNYNMWGMKLNDHEIRKN